MLVLQIPQSYHENAGEKELAIIAEGRNCDYSLAYVEDRPLKLSTTNVINAREFLQRPFVSRSDIKGTMFPLHATQRQSRSLGKNQPGPVAVVGKNG